MSTLAMVPQSAELIEAEIMLEHLTIDLCSQCGQTNIVATMDECGTCGYVCMTCAILGGCACPVPEEPAVIALQCP